MQDMNIPKIWGQAWTAYKRNWLTGTSLFILLSVIPTVITTVSAQIRLSNIRKEIIRDITRAASRYVEDVEVKLSDAEVLLFLLYVLVKLGSVALVVNLIARIFLPVASVQWGLRAVESSEPIPFAASFPSRIGTYLNALLGLILIALLPAIMVYSELRGIIERAMQIFNREALELLNIPDKIISFGDILYAFTPPAYTPILQLIFLADSLPLPKSIVNWIFVLLGMKLLFFAYTYWVVDKKKDVFSSLWASLLFFFRHFGKVVFFFIAAVLVNLIGALPCGLGLLVTIPWTWAATALLYKSLTTEAQTSSSDPAA